MPRKWCRAHDRNAHRGSYDKATVVRKISTMYPLRDLEPPNKRRTRVSRWLYGKPMRGRNKLTKRGKAHEHLRQRLRQGRNNPTAGRITDAELDARSEALS